MKLFKRISEMLRDKIEVAGDQLKDLKAMLPGGKEESHHWSKRQLVAIAARVRGQKRRGRRHG
jgi:hypothetical protein